MRISRNFWEEKRDRDDPLFVASDIIEKYQG